MDLNELRPHMLSRIAHEFGIHFLENLVFYTKNKMLEKDAFVNNSFDSKELARQESAKYEPGLLMDALYKSAQISGHLSDIQDTKPKGHQFVQMITNSCHIVIARKNSINTKNSNFYIEQARSNIGLVKESQRNLLAQTLIDDKAHLDDLLFVCVMSYWHSESESLDLDFIIPHPVENKPIFCFSLAELKKSSLEPMTDVAEEPILKIKKRLEQADDRPDASGE